MSSNPPCPLYLTSGTPEIFSFLLPFLLTFHKVPLRSLTNRSSLGRKAIPHGTSKPSAKFSTKKVSLSVISTDSSHFCISLAFVEQEKINISEVVIIFK